MSAIVQENPSADTAIRQISQISFLDQSIWTVIAVTACTAVISFAVGSFAIEWASFVKPGIACISLILAGLFYQHIRKDRPLAEALHAAAQIIAFAAVAAPLSYVAASAAFPLWDAEIASWDRDLGFDWMACLAFMNAKPGLHFLTQMAYASFAFQASAVVIALGIAKQEIRLRVFILAFMVTTLIAIAISAVFPAQGVWGHIHLTLSASPKILPTTRDLHLPIFFGLRDGTYRYLVAETAQGIITFPSLHAGFGILFMIAVWPVKYVRWIALVVNLLMIMATPVDGGHYLSDIIAGLLIATASWIIVSKSVQKSQHFVGSRFNFTYFR